MESLKNSSKTVSNADLKRFADWMEEFGNVWKQNIIYTDYHIYNKYNKYKLII